MNEDLRAVVQDAVSDVEPADRLGRIRRRTTRRSARRRLVGGGALVAAAAVVVAGVVSVLPAPDPGRPVRVLDPSGAAGSRVAPTTPVYYVGAGPDGPDAPADVLYRYFEPAASPLDLLTRPPTDPDYRTLWPAGAFVSASPPRDGVITVELGGEALEGRPEGLTRAEAVLALQQVVYTLQADAQELAPVVFTASGTVLDRVYGVPTPAPVERGPELAVLSHVSLSDPVEGARYDDAFVARGVANGFEGTVSCRLLDADDEAAWQGTAVAGGLLDEQMNPWELRVEVDDVPPGTYSLTCVNDDPTAGAEGRGTDSDTRTVVVE